MKLSLALATLMLLILGPALGRASPVELLQNGNFTQRGTDAKTPAHFEVQGDAAWVFTGYRGEYTEPGIALYSSDDLDKDGRHAGSVSQTVTGLPPGKERWYALSFRGLPEEGFAVSGQQLFMKADFFSHGGAYALDGVTRNIYPLVERDRHDLAANGVRRQGGAAVWKTYTMEFSIPFAEVDQLRVSVGFDRGVANGRQDAIFYVTDLSLAPIPTPAGQAVTAKPVKEAGVSPTELAPVGGHWFYQREPSNGPLFPLKVTYQNAQRLVYQDGRSTNPFAENMTAWLRKGYLDLDGNQVTQDRLVADNVTLEFPDANTMILHARNLPNHPTAAFPEEFGNPSYIQEHQYTYYLPLNPVRNPNAQVMTAHDANRALPMGAIGVAINGVVFYNPFDAGMQDATDLMDRCCGHPSPDNRYHYHKYPVCVKSPFVDEGEAHSPLIGWAFDGFPIYGPYESKGVMAKDSVTNPLNGFNLHYDKVRGWHYHVTPGKFPYIIGGYWGTPDPRNLDQRGRPSARR